MLSAEAEGHIAFAHGEIDAAMIHKALLDPDEVRRSSYHASSVLYYPLVKFAVQVKIARLKRGFTQEKMARQMGIGLLPYQRLESGNNNPTLKTILKLKEVLPEVSLDKLAS